ncbi:hypothetical protein PBI_SPORTO_78 [Arthrobacter phage Sporto]|nr:hypothetical protein PBI_SPORTO_78 [Arthrobacter phage Sporto]
MISEMGRAITSMHQEAAAQLDKQLLQFFGSQDDLMKYGHLYVLEAEPVKMELMSHADFEGNTFMCQAVLKTRIRRKTAEELDADRKD